MIHIILFIILIIFFIVQYFFNKNEMFDTSNNNIKFLNKYQLKNILIQDKVIFLPLGVLSINIEIEKIKSNKAPKDLPQQLLQAFDKQFETKIKRIVKRYEESNTTKQTDTKEDGLSS